MTTPELSELAELWAPHLRELCAAIRTRTRGALADAVENDELDRLARQVGQGAGDVTFGLDVPAEEAVVTWMNEHARHSPISVLTEDVGWRHLAPGASPGAEPIELSDFEHGGPRIAIDPVDGTRHLMSDLRSAWTVVAFAGPGAAPPRMSEIVLGIVSELPDTRAASYRSLTAVRDAGCRIAEHALPDNDGDLSLREAPLIADDELRLDHAYFPFFKYMPDLRPHLAEIEACFFERLQRLEGADVSNCYDDQYISNAGQLFHLARGTYRMITDLRAWIAERRGQPTITAKPYDLAGAVLCATEAGCVITAPDGSQLDFELDTETPVSFVGWANRVTHERLQPHLQAALQS